MNNWDLEIHHINVGQGDSTFIVIYHNNVAVHRVLIDGGVKNQGETVYNYINNTFGEVIIDCAIISHFHDDHQGGIEWLVGNGYINEENVITRLSDIHEFTDILNFDDPNAPKLIMLGKNFTILNYNITDQESTIGENGNSMVFLIDFNGFYYYTAGDMDEYEIWDVAHKIPDLDDDFGNPYYTSLGRLFCYFNNWVGDDARTQLYDYLAENDGKLFYDPPQLPVSLSAFKVSHHGANNGNVTSQIFLDSTLPKVGVISVGDRFTSRATPLDYDHPRVATLERMDTCPSLEAYFATNMATSERAYFNESEEAMVDEDDDYDLNEFDVPLEEFVYLEEENVPEALHHRLTLAQNIDDEDRVFKYMFMREYFDEDWPDSNLITANEYTIWLKENDAYDFSAEFSNEDTKTIIYVSQEKSQNSGSFTVDLNSASYLFL